MDSILIDDSLDILQDSWMLERICTAQQKGKSSRRRESERALIVCLPFGRPMVLVLESQVINLLCQFGAGKSGNCFVIIFGTHSSFSGAKAFCRPCELAL